jgi:acyl-CoA dehydrogenase
MTDTDFVAIASSILERSGAKRSGNTEKAFTDALLAQARAEKLFSACVPTSFGGAGLGLADTARITERLARVSGSLGLIYAMHMSQLFSVVEHGKGAFFDAFLRRVVKDQILIASGTSEKGPGGDIFTSICLVETLGDGQLSITKESPNISYLDHAGAILVTANMAQAKGKPKQILAVVEMANIEKSSPYETEFLGMKGILNKPWKISGSFTNDAVFPVLFAPIARDTMTPTIQVLWAALWSGIAWGVLDKAKAFIGKEIPTDSDMLPVLHHELTRLINKHYLMNSMIRDAIAEYELPRGGQGLSFGPAARINRLKVEASEMLNQICQGALGLIGIRAYATGGPYSLATAVADAMSAPIMVSNYRLSMNNAKIEGYVDEGL